jgi:hypothetical protein
MEKKLDIFFSGNRHFEINAKIIASLVANKEFEGNMEGRLDNYLKRVEELEKNDFELIRLTYSIPWSVLKEYAVEISRNLDDEWKMGKATAAIVQYI